MFLLGVLGMMQRLRGNCYLISCLVSILYVKGQGTEKYNQFVNVIELNSTKCEQLNNTWECPTLEKALTLTDLNSTSIKIFTAYEQLSRHIHIIKVDTLTITTADKTSKTSIKCEPTAKAKLSFIDSSNIYIYGLTFKSCGSSHPDDFIIAKKNKIYLSSAFYLKNITGFIVNDTIFTRSAGYGIVMVDVVNTVYYKTKVEAHVEATFTSTLNLNYGGGIILISSAGELSDYNSITFKNCSFSQNNANQNVSNTFKFNSSNNQQVQNDGVDFFIENMYGNGGAMSFYFWSKEVSLNLTIKGCFFNKNKALWGGAVYIEFAKSTKGNIVNISDTHLNGNYARYAGGGIRINIAKHSNTNNSIYIKHSLFLSNGAEVGGGFAQRHGFKTTMKASMTWAPETFVEFCNFLENKATLGSAIFIERASLLLFSTSITNNAISRGTNETSSGPTITTVNGVGALFARQSQVGIHGTEMPARVSRNLNTAFVLSYSYLFVNGIVIFEDNQGSEGGAVSLYEESAIILYDTTHLLFKNNKANVGGALYVFVTGPTIPIWNSPDLFLYKCFFQFLQTTQETFKGNVTFADNDAARKDGDAIFSNLLQTCRKSSSEDSSKILTSWPNFNFTGNFTSFITTVPVKIITKEEEWNNLQPGIKFSANITLIDERGHSVEAPIDITFEPEDKFYIKNSRMIVSNNQVDLKIFGVQNIPFNITIKTPSGRALPKQIRNKTLNICDFGFSFSKRTKSCTCVNTKNEDRMISRCVGKDVYLYTNIWAYPFQKAASTDDETTQVCPHGYCNVTCNQQKDSDDCKYNYHYQCAKNRNQSYHNYLCAECSSGYSVVLGSEECRDCRGNSKWWALLLILLAFSVLVVVILWINVDVYRWFLNSLIFYYQVVYLLFTPTQDTDVVMRGLMGAVDFRGFGGRGLGFCVHDGFNDMNKIAFNFSIPVLMIVTLVIIIILTEKCPCTLPFEQVNTFRAILFIMVLAYNNMTRITLDILKVVEIDGKKRVANFAVLQYLHDEHLRYAVPAFIILIVIVIGVPFALIVPIMTMKLEWERCNFLIHNRLYISFIRPFLESFLSVFNDDLKCCLFSAFYFVFRLILLIMSTFIKRSQFQLTMMACFCFIMSLLFSKVRPYRSSIYNYFDMFILCNLTIIAFLSNGKLKLPLWDHTDDIINQTIVVLLWIPLVTWLIALVWSHWGIIKERFLRVYARCRNRYALVDNMDRL